MQELKQEIECLKNTEPPQDYTTDQIKAWLEALKSNPNETAVHLLIERIDIKTKTALKIQSTLNTILGEIVLCGRLRYLANACNAAVAQKGAALQIDYLSLCTRGHSITQR